MASIAYIIVKLLAKEARRCANTQIREVIVAYYHFFEDRENVPLNTETDSNREQETKVYGYISSNDGKTPRDKPRRKY